MLNNRLVSRRNGTFEKVIRAHFDGLISNALQRSLIEKQNALEGHSTSLQEKSQRIEVQQRQVEGLLKQLAIKIPESTTSATGGSRKPDSLMEQLKRAEAQLDAQEQLLREISVRAQRRIDQEYEGYRKKCEYLMIGMTEEEVKAVMGDPQAVKEWIDVKYRDPHVGHFWYYRGRSYGLTLSLGKTGILQKKSLVLPTDESLNRCSILLGH